MAITTNYGWGTPDDTDLVKDGALAIRDLGQDIDTTTKALNPETTTGDIAYRSATADTNTRLGIGTAGQVLTVNSGATAPEWATPGAGSSFSGCYLTTASTQSLTNNTLTAITFAGETFDTDGYHSTSSNTSRITIPVGKAGYYLFTALQTFTTNGTGVREVRIRTNGTSNYFGLVSVGANSSDGVAIQLSAILNLAEGDYVEQFALQTSGGPLNAESGSRFACTFLGA
jgi:hypothetical protein